jgi:hypothetical protein
MALGVVAAEDWRFVSDSGASLLVPGSAVSDSFRVSLRRVIHLRVLTPEFNLDEYSVRAVASLLDDVVSLVFEMAAYEQVYGVLVDGVLDARSRIEKSQWKPSRHTEDRSDVFYRREDPSVVLERSEAAIEQERLKIAWAKSKMRRSAPGNEKAPVPTSRGKGVSRRPARALVGVDAVLAMLESPAVAKRVSRLRKTARIVLDLTEAPGVDVSSLPVDPQVAVDAD